MSPRSRPTALSAAIRHHQAGRLVEAVRAYRAASATIPGDPRVWSNLGSVLGGLGRLAEAATAYRRALSIEPDQPDLWVALGRLLARQGAWHEAIDALQRAIDWAPDRADLRKKLGDILTSAGQYPDALTQLERAVELDPEDAETRVTLANLFILRQQLDKAYGALLAAVALAPEDSSIRAALGTTLALQGSLRAAEGCYRVAAELGNRAGNEFRAALLLPTIPQSHEEMMEWRGRYGANIERLLESDLRLQDPLWEVGSASFNLAFHGLDDRALQERLALLYQRACPSLTWTAPRRRRRGGRTRLGIISCNLRQHTIGKVNRGIIDRLDRERFEVTVILGPNQDVVTQAVAAAADNSVTLYGSLDDMRQQVASVEPDILFYPDIGMEPTSYFLAYARIAPVQVVTWGHPDTTGIPNVDYYVSSELVEGEGAQELYSESLVQLSRIPTYYYRPPVGDDLPGRARLPFEEDWKVYACPQSLFKVHPDFDAIIGAILRRDPQGRVVLVDSNTQHWSETLNDRLERAIPDVADRVLFLPRLTEFDYFNLLAGADALLDTIHFGGGSTTYEALAIGSPVVTWPGRLARSRVTAACYARMGMMDLVAQSAEEYVETAFRLANDRAWRDQRRRDILDSNGALFEDGQAVRELEVFFERALVDAGVA